MHLRIVVVSAMELKLQRSLFDGLLREFERIVSAFRHHRHYVSIECQPVPFPGHDLQQCVGAIVTKYPGDLPSQIRAQIVLLERRPYPSVARAQNSDNREHGEERQDNGVHGQATHLACALLSAPFRAHGPAP